jgi:hypothetical protein
MSKLESGLSIKPTPAEKIAALDLPPEDQAKVNEAIDQAVADSKASDANRITLAARLLAWVDAQPDPQAAVDAIMQA